MSFDEEKEVDEGRRIRGVKRVEPPVLGSNMLSGMRARTEGLVHPTSCDTSTKTDAATNQQQFSLIPLHPASKRTKLDAKQLPIVMGRTNLAAWWWKSCPCQNYCRLHCRPVAQNIRSLSKVMVQVDTAGRVHVVGKNPHLITITPDRGDNTLQLNDIIIIGRRDREPWMRFQVVQKPEGNPPVASCTRRRSSSGTTKVDQAPHTQPWVGTLPPAPPSSVAPTTNSTTCVRKLPNQDNHRSVEAPLPNRKIILNLPRNLDISTTPPEWITTNTRKRNSDRTERSLIAASKTSPPAVERMQEFQPSRQQHNAGTNVATRTSTSQYHATTTNNNPQLPATRKRRRPCIESLGAGSRPKRLGYQVNTQGSSDKTGSVGTGATPHGDSSKRDHLQVHVVFQDYQTSAILLQDNELKRKSDSLIHHHGSKDSASRQEGSPHSRGTSVPPPASEPAIGSQSRHDNASVALLPITGIHDKIPKSKAAPSPDAMESIVIKSARRPLFIPSSEELSVQVPAKDTTATVSSQGFAQSNVARKNAVEVEEEPYEASMLSLPQCASSTLEEGQKSMPVELSSSNKDGLAASKKDDEDLDDESVSSPPSCDPIMDLKPWQDMIEHEEKKGTAQSFRHALASLIVAKNQDRLGPEGKRGLLWLPPLLGNDFKIEPNGRT